MSTNNSNRANRERNKETKRFQVLDLFKVNGKLTINQACEIYFRTSFKVRDISSTITELYLDGELNRDEVGMKNETTNQMNSLYFIPETPNHPLVGIDRRINQREKAVEYHQKYLIKLHRQRAAIAPYAVPKCLPFGKYEYTPIDQLPTDYLKWCNETIDFRRADLRIAVELELQKRNT